MLKEGQVLWFVPYEKRWSREREVVVSKVGRKWAVIDDGRNRVDASTLEVDGKGYVSPGKCYVSREVYEIEKARRDSWQALRRALDERRSAPDGVTTESIAAAAALLNIQLL